MPRVLAMAILVASIGCVDLLNGATCSKDGDCGDYICESGRCTEPSDLTTNEDGTGSPDRGTNTGSRDAGTTSNNNQCLPGGEDCGAGTVLGLTCCAGSQCSPVGFCQSTTECSTGKGSMSYCDESTFKCCAGWKCTSHMCTKGL